MPKNWTHTEAFAHFGTTPRNVRWSWSARNEKTKVVVGTFWQDLFKTKDGQMYYDRTGVVSWASSSPAWPEWRENLAWAEDYCEGKIHTIVAIAKDREAVPREIMECFPRPIIMRLTYLDRASGEFIAKAE